MMTTEELFALDIEQNVKDIDSGEDDSYYRGRLAGMLSAYRILKEKPYDDGNLISRLAVEAEEVTIKDIEKFIMPWDMEIIKLPHVRSFDDPSGIVDFINEHHIKKENIKGIVRGVSYYLTYFEEESNDKT